MALRKIAYLTPLYFDENAYLGGGERFALNLAKGVVHASGGSCAVELISYGKTPQVRALAPGVGLRVLRDGNRHVNPFFVVSWDLPAAIADADLVHVHAVYSRSSEVGIVAARQQHKPLCLTDHGGRWSPLGVDLGSMDLADQIVAYSDFGAAQYDTATPIEVIKGGVDAELFTPPARPPRRDHVLFVGRLLPHKGVDRLIEAMPPELPLTVCGQPHWHHYYEHLQDLARGKKVEFVTDADDATILELYRRAWANVLPSVYTDCYGNSYETPELMGFTLLEAMACGTPAIASRIAAMPEFIDDGRTGFVFDGPDDLADRLRLLAGDPALVERMGREARREVERRYDLKVAGRKLLEVYRALLERSQEEEAA
jgi:glycosyltransferase involved in cell wall biosynthesis